MTRAAILLWLLLGVACNGSSHSERHFEQGFTASLPAGWRSSFVRGNVQLTSPEQSLAKHTIIVRAADKPRELREGTPATAEHIVDTTEQVLRGLRKAEIARRAAIVGAKLPGAVFTLSFVPRGLARPYQREHAVLVGKKRMFHIIYTAPAGEPVDKAAFERVVTTLVEEA